MKTRTALYIRVSTHEQNTQMQLQSLQEYAQLAGLKITHEYIEEGVSGHQSSRPKLNQMMQDANAHQFDNVLVWKFDRFARSVSHLVKAMEEFKHLGIRFISQHDQIDTESPMGKAMFVLIGAMAELEGDLIRDRVKEGMKNAKAQGKVIGRPKTKAYIIDKVQQLATETDLSINQICTLIRHQASRAVVGKIVQNARKG